MKASMKKLITRFLQLMSTPIVQAYGNYSLTPNANNEGASITLKANRTYLVLAYTSYSYTSEHTEAITMYVKSGTASASRFMTGKHRSDMGGGVVGVGYITTATQVVLGTRMYGYINQTGIVADCFIIAIPTFMGGVARSILKALQSLAYRKAVVV